MKKITCISALLVLLASCKKEQPLPAPEIADPHFYVSCSMDGKPLMMEAGNEDYYMNASWYRQDSAGMYVYKANLARQEGTGYQVTILINDYKNTNVNASMNTDSALWLGEHLYNDENISGITQNISFKPLGDMKPSAIYSWLVTDGTSPRTYPGGSDGVDYCISSACETGKTYSVTLNYNDGMGTCSTSHTNVFKAGSKLQTAISAERVPGTSELKYNLSYTPLYGGSYSCKWFVDGNPVATNTTLITRNFQPNTYNIKLELRDNLGSDSCVSYYQLDATNFNACDANFKASFSPVKNIRLYSSVTILLTDPNGLVYSSTDLVQPESSSFEILDIFNYKANESNQPTKRLKVKFNCVVKNGASEINLTNGEAIIAVAYK